MKNSEDRQKRNETTDPALEKLSGHFSAHANSIDTNARPGFKHALQMRIQGAREQHRMSKFSFAQFFQGVPGRLAAVGTTALVVALVALIIFQPFAGTVPTVYAQDNFTLIAEEEDGLGIDARTSFLLESRTEITVADVEDLISSNISLEPSFEQVSNTVIRITFAEPLPEGEIVQITLDSSILTEQNELQNRDYGWAFQVRDPFSIMAHLPADQTSNVPTNTGIEFTFSNENVTVESFQQAFSISPEVEGRFEKERDTLVFVPDALASQTLYTVTLKGTLSPDGSTDALGEDVVIAFETAAVKQAPVERVYFYSDINHFAPGETVRLPISNSRNLASAQSGTFYKFADVKDYAAAIKAFSDVGWRTGLGEEEIFGSAIIEEQMSATFTKTANESGYQQDTLNMDGTLSAGSYALNIIGEGTSSWTFVDVSNLAVYYATAQNEQLVWINDVSTDSVVSGASVTSLFLDASTTSNENGIATLPPLSTEVFRDAILIENGEDAIVVEHNARYYGYGWNDGNYNTSGFFMRAGSYWAYMYTDRSSYLPTDKIEVWGYLRDRDGMEDVESVDLVLSNRGYEYNRVKADVMDGFYRATIDTFNYQPGWYGLQVMNGEQRLSYASVTVLDYTKPAYELTASVNAGVIKAGETVEIDVQGTFFDGTPVKGLELSAGVGKDDIGTITLDGNGEGTFVHTPAGFTSGSLTSRVSYRIAPVRVEEGEIYTQETVTVLLTETYVTAKGEVDGTQGSVEFTTYQTDKETIGKNLYNPEFALKPAQTVSGTVTERWTEQVEEGVIYDNVSKTTRPNYRYVQHAEVIGEFSVTTNDEAKAIYVFEAPREEARYEISYRVTDEFGAVYASTRYLYRLQEREEPVGQLYFSADLDRNVGARIGEEVQVNVTRDQSQFTPKPEGSFFYLEAQRGIHKTTVSKNPVYTFTFGEEHVPDVYVYGAYFDGQGFAVIGGNGLDSPGAFHVPMDHAERQLSLEVEAPDSVRPGEEVKISVDVTDKDGNPVESQVNLSLVDEAYFALFPGYLDTLGVLYSTVVSGVSQVSITRNIEELVGGAEGGGGGGDEGRADFKDTAAFVTANTDQNGHAEVSLTLPDNLTSWRISAQAISLGGVSEGIFAGHTIDNIAATLPYFVVPVMKDSYLDGDEPQIVVRSAGTELEAEDEVSYRMWIQGEDFEDQIATANGNETVRFELPDLAPGVYGVTVNGSANGSEDRVTREVTILSSRIQVPVIATQDLEPGTTLSGQTDGLTWIRFMDASRGKLYSDLQHLSWSYGDRADQLLARNIANDLLREEFNGTRLIENGSVSDYQDENGHVRLLPYSSSSFELTAKAAFARGTVFDEAALRNALQEMPEGVELDQESSAWRLAGLAALGEPVLLDLRLALEFTEKDHYQVRLPLVLGLYYIGATEEARVHYRDITNRTKEAVGRRSLDLENPESNLELTSLLGILAAGLNEPQADEYWEFLSRTYSKNTTVVLEKAFMLREWVPHLSDETPTVEYTLHGERVKETLENGSSDRIVLRPDEFASLNLASDGKIVVVTEYFGGPEELEGEPTDSITMEREYRVNGQTTNTFKEGDLVEVRITRNFGDTDFTKTSYELTDVLPSGLSLVSSPRSARAYDMGTQYCVNYPRKMVDNRMTFYTWASYARKGCDPFTTIYYARVVTPGKYEAEPAFLQSYEDPSTYAFSSESQQISITE